MNPLRAFFLLLILCFSKTGAATTALSRYECLRELLQISDRREFQQQRRGFDAPFQLQDRYIVFPEVGAQRVTGFYVYDTSHAWYFDGVELGRDIEMAELSPDPSRGVLRLVAQPNGIETITIRLLPGYSPGAVTRQGAAMLGSSVLPVVGAFVSRAARYRPTYFDPGKSPREEVSAWLAQHPQRLPAAKAGTDPIKSTIVKMVGMHAKSHEALFFPMNRELKIRGEWIQAHNLDEKLFKNLRRAIDGNCS